MGAGTPRRTRSLDGPRRHRVTFLASEAELAELTLRAERAGISVARYVAAAALERAETVSERRVWATEISRAERVMRRVEKLLVEVGANPGARPSEITEAVAAVRDAALVVAAMGEAAVGR